MDNQELYQLLADNEIKLPSSMGVVPSANLTFSREYIEGALKKSKYFELVTFEEIEPEEDSPSEMGFEGVIRCREEEFEISFFVTSSELIDFDNFGFGNQLLEGEFDPEKVSPYFLETSMYFGKNTLESYHLQLKILNAIVPDAAVVLDFMPFRMLSGQWLKMTAQSEIPPSPDYLYTVHSVYSEDENITRYWLHTHGLHRCGSPELEIINISQGPQQMFDMLNIVAKKFINGDIPREKENFTVGYDGLGIQLCWTQWENAMSLVPENASGGLNDRGEEGDIHREPSAVLYAAQEDHMVSPEIYVSTLADNPLYYISNSETNRMSQLAKERFHLFRSTFDEKNKKNKRSWNPFAKKKEEEWTFLVKLGLTVDNATEENEKEHLWFTVLNIENDQIFAELLNEPYWIASLKKGVQKNYPVEVLTDWIIYSPDNTYTTDTIYQLYHNL